MRHAVGVEAMHADHSPEVPCHQLCLQEVVHLTVFIIARVLVVEQGQLVHREVRLEVRIPSVSSIIFYKGLSFLKI